MEDPGEAPGSSELLLQQDGAFSKPQSIDPKREDPLQMQDIELEGENISATQETEEDRFLRHPGISYLVLTGIQSVLGVLILALGGAAFAITPTYRAGSFWAGLIILVTSVYNLAWYSIRPWFLERENKQWFRKKRKILSHLVVILCFFCMLVTIAAAIMDITAAYWLLDTDFSRCQHTDIPTTTDCHNEICPLISLPPDTCYCCYLYKERNLKSCKPPFLMENMPYFEGVSSCGVISKALRPMVFIVGLLAIQSTIFNIIFLIKNRAILYYEAKELEEEFLRFAA